MTKKQMSASEAGPAPDRGSHTLDPRLQAHIGRQLKSMYDEYLSEPVPDHLIELLEKLDQIPSGENKTDGEPA